MTKRKDTSDVTEDEGNNVAIHERGIPAVYQLFLNRLLQEHGITKEQLSFYIFVGGDTTENDRKVWDDYFPGVDMPTDESPELKCVCGVSITHSYYVANFEAKDRDPYMTVLRVGSECIQHFPCGSNRPCSRAGCEKMFEGHQTSTECVECRKTCPECHNGKRPQDGVCATCEQIREGRRCPQCRRRRKEPQRELCNICWGNQLVKEAALNEARKKQEQEEKEADWVSERESFLTHEPAYNRFKLRRALWLPEALKKSGGLQLLTVSHVVHELKRLQEKLHTALEELHRIGWWRKWSEEEGIRWLTKELDPGDLAKEFYAMLQERLPQPEMQSRLKIISLLHGIISLFYGFQIAAPTARMQDQQVVKAEVERLAIEIVESELKWSIDGWARHGHIPPENLQRCCNAVWAKEDVWVEMLKQVRLRDEFGNFEYGLFPKLVKISNFRLKCRCGKQGSRKCVQGSCAECCDAPCDFHSTAHYFRIK